MRALCTLVLLGGCVVPSSHYGVSGLDTAPNPIVGAAPGALLEADNCVIRRPGMIEPRPGFKAGTALDLDQIWKLIAYNGTFFAVGEKGGTTKTIFADTTNANTSQWSEFQIRAVEARKNLYLTTNDAVRKFTTAPQASSARAGMPAPIAIFLNTGAGASVPTLTSRAYRFTIERTDSNGLIVTGAPSSRAVMVNDTAFNIDSQVTCRFGVELGITAGDVVRLYGTYTVSSSVPVPDEMFFVASRTLSASDITAGYVVIADDTLDANLGTPLYTNATQQSIARANAQPPLAMDLALFGGSVFAGNVTWPHSVDIAFSVSASLSTAAGIGVRTYTGTRTNASAVVSGMSSTTGVKVGMILSSAGADHWSGTTPVLVTAVNSGAGTITVDKTWTGATDGAPVAIALHDTIRIKTGSEDQYYPAVDGGTFGWTLGIANTTYRTLPSAFTTIEQFGDSDTFTGSAGRVYGRVTLRVGQILPSTGSFQIWATHGSEYDPVLPEPTVGSGLSSTQDVFPNGLTWSKQDEPEHFIRGALWLVGNARAPIIRIVALREALYIFKGKGDGIYRLSGYGELSGWQVEQVDPSTYILNPELATVLEDAIYCWTNTGMCRVDSVGQAMLSGPILDLTGAIENALDPSANVPGFAFAAANLPDHEVIFGLPAKSGTDELHPNGYLPQTVYVYNTLTKAWYQWFGSDSAKEITTLAFLPSTNILAYGTDLGGTPYLARDTTETWVQQADAEYEVTISAVAGDGVTCTIAGGSGWTPVAGDLVRNGPSFFEVVSSSDATHFVAHATVTAGGVTAYVGYTSRITWLNMFEPTGAVMKRWQSFVTHWDDVYGLYSWTQTFAGVHGGSISPAYTRTVSRTSAKTETRALITPDVQLETQLKPTIIIRNADARWRITGITENSAPSTARVAL